jgi:hypothetical protein
VPLVPLRVGSVNLSVYVYTTGAVGELTRAVVWLSYEVTRNGAWVQVESRLIQPETVRV